MKAVPWVIAGVVVLAVGGGVAFAVTRKRRSSGQLPATAGEQQQQGGGGGSSVQGLIPGVFGAVGSLGGGIAGIGRDLFNTFFGSAGASVRPGVRGTPEGDCVIDRSGSVIACPGDPGYEEAVQRHQSIIDRGRALL